MVLCVVIGCSKRSERDKDVSFYRIPAIIKHTDKRDYELSKKRREGFFAAISREDVNFNAQHYRICSRHFKLGEPMKNLYDFTNPDWLPTQNLGYAKKPKGARLIFPDTKELNEEPRRVHRRNKRIFYYINKQKW